MVESSPYSMAAADDLVKIFWMINNSKYDQLRVI